ncbi:MAG: DEAD/DEAH box helicase [Alphaproteobacteria bacterium]|nr:DEAD/DEAH box helicase [Alphaproteobacteria bacterium]
MTPRVQPTERGLVVDPGGREDAARLDVQLRLATGTAAGDPIPWDALVRWLAEAEAEVEDDDRDLRALLEARLGVPPTIRPHVRLMNHGGVEDPTFRVTVEVRHPRGGELTLAKGRGPWVEDAHGRPYLLHSDAWTLLTTVDKPLPEGREAHQLWWARTKKLASRAGASLTPYLADEDAVLVERIRPVFVPEGDGIRVDLEGDGVSVDEMDRLLEVAGPAVGVRRSHTVRQPNGGRRRVVVTDEAREAMLQTTRKRRYDRREAAELLEAPERVFPESHFDLSAYSDRVVAIGPPRYRASVSLARGSVGERDWLSGVDGRLTLELRDDARPEAAPVIVDLGDEVTVEAARASMQSAIERGETFAEIEGHLVRADPEVAMALQTWRPVETVPDPRPPGLEDAVLQIKENVDALEHGTSPDGLPLVPAKWSVARPTSLAAAVQLRPHQQEGFAKLAWWRDARSAPISGGLVADDMGLGKTLQVLCLMGQLADEGRLRPSLVVAPTALLDNWVREAERFVPAAIRRVALLRDGPRGGEAALAEADLVLTSYEMLARRDLELGRIAWRLVVCDEAQKIKNPSTRMSHAVKAMKAEMRLAVTGTPVENSLDELWSITDFFQPGLLGSLSAFRERYASKAVLDDDSAREAAAQELMARIDPIILRRMKEDVAKDLPAIHRHEIPVELGEMQRLLYLRIRQGLAAGTRGEVLGTIQRLMQVCSHPLLLAPGQRGRVDPVVVCPKLAQTVSILEQVRARGEKAIVFARWLALQDLLADVLYDRFGLRVAVLNGSVPSAQRQAIVDRFSRGSGFDVLVLAARACGVGLNITAANHVIHYTREWNPAIEAQATDRAYRIGQTRDVHVYLPIVHDEAFTTVEQTLAQLLASKETLRHDFVRPSANLEIGIEDFTRDLEEAPVEIGGVDAVLRLVELGRVAEAYAKSTGLTVLEVRRDGEAVVVECADDRWIVMGPDEDAVGDLAEALPERRTVVAVLSEPKGLLGRWVGGRKGIVRRHEVVQALERSGVDLLG